MLRASDVWALSSYKRTCVSLQMESPLSEFTGPLLETNLNLRLLSWCRSFDAGTQPDPKTQLNAMHVVGLKLSSDMHCMSLPGYDEYNLTDRLGLETPLPFEQALVSELSWQQLVDLMSTMQLEFKKIMIWDDMMGYHTRFCFIFLIKCLLKRVGFWTRHSWRRASGEHDHDVLDGTLNVDDKGWHVVSVPSIVHLMDVLHVFTSLCNSLISATVVHNDDAHNLVKLHPHHHEASLDDFYLNSIVSDTPVGSVVQYSHRFQFLFHSVTQVVYFHWPSYRRSLQLPLEEIRKRDASPQSLLPILLQIDPSITVLHEHTGALLSSPENTWAWINVAGFYGLRGPQDQLFVARDLRALLLHHEALTLSTRH